MYLGGEALGIGDLYLDGGLLLGEYSLGGEALKLGDRENDRDLYQK